MSKFKQILNDLFQEHQTIASILTIIISFIAINGWMMSDVKSDVSEIRADIRETNKRIDALFHYVLTKEGLEKKV